MYRKRKAWIVASLFLVLVITPVVAGCGGPQPAPAEEATATPLLEPTITEPPEPPTVKAAIATEVLTVTVAPGEESATPTVEAGEEVQYELPVKGDPEAPVTIIEFSDYL